MAEVFISYAAEDGEIARFVAERLRGERYDVWYYQGDGQTPGQDYMDNIGDGVRNARVVVLFVSPSALASPQCNSEAQIAWEESKEVIPLLRGLTFACVHPSFGSDEPLSSRDIVSVRDRLIETAAAAGSSRSCKRARRRASTRRATRSR